MFTNMPPEYSSTREGEHTTGETNPDLANPDTFNPGTHEIAASSPAQGQSGALPTGGQLGPQQEQMARAAMDAKSILDSKICKHIQRQLILLLYIQICQGHKSRTYSEISQCILPYSKLRKNILNHMSNCQGGIRWHCTNQLCRRYRYIVSHWKRCNRSDCLATYHAICKPIKQAFNVRLVQPLTQTAPGQSRQQVIAPNVSLPLNSDDNTVGVAGNQMVPTTRPSIETVVATAIQEYNSMRDRKNRLLANPQLPDGLQLDRVRAMPVQGRKKWHLSVSPQLRTCILHKLIKMIFSTPDPQVTLDKKMHNLVAYARKRERDIYKMAKSRLHYYYVMAEEIYKIEQKNFVKSEFENIKIHIHKQMVENVSGRIKL